MDIRLKSSWGYLFFLMGIGRYKILVLVEVMRCVEGNVCKERFFVSVFARFLEKKQCVIGDHLTPVLTTFPKAFKFWIVWTPRVRFASEGRLYPSGVWLGIPPRRFRTTSKQFSALALHMPFSCHVSFVSCFFHILGPPSTSASLCLCFWKLFSVPKKPSGVEHMPTGNADSTAP